MPTLDPDRAADTVGAVSLALGVALTVAPDRATAVLGLGPSAALGRVLGAADLAIGSPLLLRDRPRWPWTAARAGPNPVVAECHRAGARRPGAARRPAARRGGHDRARGGRRRDRGPPRPPR